MSEETGNNVPATGTETESVPAADTAPASDSAPATDETPKGDAPKQETARSSRKFQSTALQLRISTICITSA